MRIWSNVGLGGAREVDAKRALKPRQEWAPENYPPRGIGARGEVGAGRRRRFSRPPMGLSGHYRNLFGAAEVTYCNKVQPRLRKALLLRHGFIPALLRPIISR